MLPGQQPAFLAWWRTLGIVLAILFSEIIRMDVAGQAILPAAGPVTGEGLAGQLGCVQCHADLPVESIIRNQAPDLSYAGSRYRTGYLFEYLRNPVQVRRHIGRARMPGFHLTEKEALALAMYLETLRSMPAGWPDLPATVQNRLDAPPQAVAKGEFEAELSGGLACLTCHTLDGRGGPLAPELSAVGHKLHPGWLKAYLVAPARFGVAPQVMPAQFFQSTGDRARFEPLIPDADRKLLLAADFLASSGAARAGQQAAELARAKRAHPGVTAEQGEKMFRSLNCAACHPHPTVTPGTNAAPTLAGEGLRVQRDWLEQFLRKPAAIRAAGFHAGDGRRMPDFRLDDQEVIALRDFLMAQRRSPASWATNWNSAPLSAFAQEKARRLLVEKLSCLGCHRFEGRGGVIGPDLSMAGHRLQPGYVAGIIRAPQQVAPHSVMPVPPQPAETHDLVARLLAQSKSAGTTGMYLSPLEHRLPGVELTTSREATAVRRNYLRFCSACHGMDGKGDGFNAAFLPVKPTAHADPMHMRTRPDDTLFDGIHSGGAILNRSHLMPAWAGTLGAAEMRELVKYLRTLCQCEGPPWSRDGAGSR